MRSWELNLPPFSSPVLICDTADGRWDWAHTPSISCTDVQVLLPPTWCPAVELPCAVGSRLQTSGLAFGWDEWTAGGWEVVGPARPGVWM